MSQTNFNNRWPDNAPGKYYVDQACLDCDLCRETAPTIFHRNDDGGYTYVSRQPNTPDEEAMAREAIEGCPCEAIFSNGDMFDWEDGPNVPASNVERQKLIYLKQCDHCGAKRPWWKFWK